MTEHSQYEYPSAVPSVQELDASDVPFYYRDKCASLVIDYYKCLDKGTSFCKAPKDKFYECQYNLLADRLKNHKQTQ